MSYSNGDRLYADGSGDGIRTIDDWVLLNTTRLELARREEVIKALLAQLAERDEELLVKDKALRDLILNV